ncbi:hypothetical protein TRFO_05931 [Tritrichomonas foetus]|uniref:Protein kinase domain-containing protein n=1 Tax=Tritrichomonas foetus TaxID=1144522 RepID=A0A1J4K310_9EUKA|nr:hypothetical protein TRFO_05931 [Tritrichomonas foetus]|eukprot:OHT05354.1 hypothetical protein TRFO_05931 [Tritrichomonas foetus]
MSDGWGTVNQDYEIDDDYSDDENVIQIPTNLDDLQASINDITFDTSPPPCDRDCFEFLFEIERTDQVVQIVYYEKPPIGNFGNSTEISGSYYIYRFLKDGYTPQDMKELFYDPIEELQNIPPIAMMKIVQYGIPAQKYTPWICLEYVPGGTMYETVKYGRRYNTIDCWRIVYTIAHSLRILHHKKMYHRDIRLESIVIAPPYFPILNDIDMLTHKYRTRDDYPDSYKFYLSPNFTWKPKNNSSSENSQPDANSLEEDEEMIRQYISNDIYAFGVVVNLFIKGTIKPLQQFEDPNEKNERGNSLYEYNLHGKKPKTMNSSSHPEIPKEELKSNFLINRYEKIEKAFQEFSTSKERLMRSDRTFRIEDVPNYHDAYSNRTNKEDIAPNPFREFTSFDYDKFIKKEKETPDHYQDLLTKYFDEIGLSFDKVSDNILTDLLNLAERCVRGKISTVNKIIDELVIIAQNSYFPDQVKEYGFPADLEKYDTRCRNEYRGTYQNVVTSASKLNAADIKLLTESDYALKKDPSQVASESTLYATITQDLSFYERSLQTPVKRNMK